MAEKYPLKESQFSTYDMDWYELISQAKQTGYSKLEVRTILRNLGDTHHLTSD